MAENTSIGKIQLDLELSKDSMGKEIKNLEKAFIGINLAGGFKNSLDGFTQNLNNFIKNDITNLTNSIRESVDALAELNKPMEIDTSLTENKFSGLFRKIGIFSRNSMGKVTNSVRDFEQASEKSVDEISNTADIAASKIENSFSDMFRRIIVFSKDSVSKTTGDLRNFAQVGAVASDQVSKSISKMNTEYEKTEFKIADLRKEMSKLVAEQSGIGKGFQDLPAFTGMSKEDSTAQMLKSNPRYDELSEQISSLTAKMDPLIAKNQTLSQEITKAGNSAGATGSKLSFMGKNTNRAGKDADKATLKTRLFGDEMKKSGTKAVGFAAMLNRSFMTIVKRLFVYNLILKGIRELTSYTGAALNTNKQFVNSLNQVKTNLMVAFQPIYDYILPALNALMRGVATVTAYIASAISALFGKTYEQSFGSAKGLESAKKEMAGYGKAAKKAGKDAKGALMGFDEINQLDVKDDADSDSGGGAGDFEMTMPDTSTIDLSGLERFKSLLQPTIDSLKNLGLALTPLKDFAVQGLKDFYSEFLVPVGKWTFGEGLPRFIVAITNGLGKIDWPRINDSLKGLFQNLSVFAINFGEGALRFWENFLVPLSTWVIGEGFPRLVDIISNGLALINWEPILAAFDRLWQVLLPFSINIGEGLLWLLENVLVPLAAWTVNEVLPRFLDILTESLNILSEVVATLTPHWQWLWDNFFEPIAKWTGGIIVSVLDGIIGALKSIGDWISNNKTAVETMAIVIGSFMAAWEIVSLVKIIGGIVGALVTFISTGGLATAVMTAFKAAILFLTSPIGIAVVAIGALIATGVLLYKHWDVVKEYAIKTWDGIKNVFTTFENWLTNSFSKNWSREFGLFGDVINTFFKNAKNIFDGVKQVFQGIITFLTGTFTGNWRKAFQGLADIMKGITSTFVAIMKAPLNGVIGLMNSAISGLNKIKVPDWVPGVGGKGVSIPKIPMLAKGGIIDQPTLAMVGERGKEAVMPLENNTGWITDLANQIASIMGGAGGNSGSSGDTTLIVKIGEDTLVEKIISGINRQNRISGETVITV